MVNRCMRSTFVTETAPTPALPQVMGKEQHQSNYKKVTKTNIGGAYALQNDHQKQKTHI